MDTFFPAGQESSSACEMYGHLTVWRCVGGAHSMMHTLRGHKGLAIWQPNLHGKLWRDGWQEKWGVCAYVHARVLVRVTVQADYLGVYGT